MVRRDSTSNIVQIRVAKNIILALGSYHIVRDESQGAGQSACSLCR